MSLAAGRWLLTTRVAAALVPGVQRESQRTGDEAMVAADVDRRRRPAKNHRQNVRVTGQPSGLFGGDGCAVAEDGVAELSAEGGEVDGDVDPGPVTSGTGCGTAGLVGVDDLDQGVGALR